MNERKTEWTRSTRETEINLTLMLDGAGNSEIRTGIGLLDHLLAALVCQARFDLALDARGDLAVDDHHTAEDCGIVLGQALDHSLGNRKGIARFGSAFAPMDEALARAVVDFSGRPYAAVELGLVRAQIGDLSAENVGHVLSSLAVAARATLHVDLLRGANDHHRAEAAFKAVGLALRAAVARDRDGLPSTKGVL